MQKPRAPRWAGNRPGVLCSRKEKRTERQAPDAKGKKREERAMETLLLVDGHNLLFQMFFGMPARIVNRAGASIGGTLGFVGALLKIIRSVRPTHMALLFDGEHPNDRAALDEDYKANRPDYSLAEEECPFSQLPNIYTALDYMGIAHTEVRDFETDDTIAAYVLSRERGTRVVIASFDSDFFQLISEDVSVLRYRGICTQLCDPAYVRERCGVEPAQYADWKSLVGDRADNVRGVPGIGPKTAAALLLRYGDLDGVLAHTEEIARPSVRRALEEHKDRVLLNRKLITLQNRATLPFSPEQMRYQYNGLTTGEVLRGIGLQP